jgi:hypothetical protein
MDYVIITGRAEISRLILAYAGVRYTDERLGQLKYLFSSFLSSLLCTKLKRGHTVSKNDQLISYIFFAELYILHKQKITNCKELYIFLPLYFFLLKILMLHMFLFNLEDNFMNK